MAKKITSTLVRQKLLELSPEVIDAMASKAFGDGLYDESEKPDFDALKILMRWCGDVAKDTDEPVPMEGMQGMQTYQERVDYVIAEINAGNLTPDQGEKALDLLEKGFTISELPDLIGRLEEQNQESKYSL